MTQYAKTLTDCCLTRPLMLQLSCSHSAEVKTHDKGESLTQDAGLNGYSDSSMEWLEFQNPTLRLITAEAP